MFANIIGFASLILACLAIVIFVLFPQNEMLMYGSWVLAGVFVALWIILNRKSITIFFTKKSTRYGANFALVVFLVLGIIVFINILSKDYHLRTDITRSKMNSLSPQSLKILKELNQDVKVYYFNTIMEKEKKEPLFKNYEYVSKKFKYEFVDTGKRPTFTQSMEVKANDTVVLTLEGTNKKMKVDGTSEEKITNALIKLLRSKDQTLYFTSGHGERPLQNAVDPLSYSMAKDELTKQGYTVKELNLMADGKIPADAAVVMVLGPQKEFFPKELDVLRDWIKAGGHAMIAVDLDPTVDGLTTGSRQVSTLVSQYGVIVANNMLVDPTSRAANVEPQILLGFAGSKDHPITKDFPTSTMGLVANFFFPLTTYLTSEKKENIEITSLAKTSQAAWAESDWKALKGGMVKFKKGIDHSGVMDMAYAIEVKKPGMEKADKKDSILTRLAIFATSTFAGNSLLDKAGNRDLFLNTVAWLVNDEQFISIRPKEEGDGDKMQANPNAITMVFLITVFLLPLITAISGIVVWWRRSRQ